MMTQVLDPMDIYERGLRDLSSLRGEERLVFMFQDFDNLMEMEGWDHFFTYEHHFIWYAEMTESLRKIGDEASLCVLENYENHLKARGVGMSPGEIRTFLNSTADDYLAACPDWCGQYCELREDRWTKANTYFRNQGVELLMA
jgi:hypothetical protein